MLGVGRCYLFAQTPSGTCAVHFVTLNDGFVRCLGQFSVRYRDAVYYKYVCILSFIGGKFV